MSDPTSRLPARPSLEQLRKQAKELLRDYLAGRTAAVERFHLRKPQVSNASLSDAQFVLAREYGFESWAKLVHHVEAVQSSGRLEQFEQLAKTLANAYSTGDATAIRELNWNYGTSFVWDHQPAQMQRRLSRWFASTTRATDLAVADAQEMVAGSYGFESWAKFAESIAQPPSDPCSDSLGMSSTPPFYRIDRRDDTISLRGPLSERDWDTIVGVIEDHQITGLRIGGMTDGAMRQLPQLDCVTRLYLGGSTQLTDNGLKHLAHMPQLQELEMGGWSSPITDRGLAVLRHLPELRSFHCGWSQGISDIGVANLNACDQLESVNLMGTPTGDGAIKAFAGKSKLRRFKTGKLVTDAGLPLLHEFPVFKAWHGGEIKYSLMSADAEPNHLLLDGPFTDKGLSKIAGLDGLFALTFFWHISALTSDGLEPLARLANLGFLGCQNELCNDVAMGHIAAIPRLRMLMGQGTVASDDGFETLSRSQTIEYIWGRECPNLGGRGFAAMAGMPALKGLAVSCKNVDDTALSALPRFPALRGLMPMDVTDDGFRHVGRCQQLENLWCMYCRETGDLATTHIAGLSNLKSYYAGATKITDHSLEVLGRMSSLEELEFYECAGITNEGLAFLVGLPRLREVTIEGSPSVTRQGMSVFPDRVRANYW